MIRIGIYATLFVAWTAFTVVSGMFWVVSVVSGLLATYFIFLLFTEIVDWLQVPHSDLQRMLVCVAGALITAMETVLWMNDFIPLSIVFGVICIIFLGTGLLQFRKWRRTKRLRT